MAERSNAHLAFGRTVRAHRESRGLSQEELAASSGLHRTYVSGIERGERNLSLESILKLAAGLQVEAAQLFESVGSQRSTSTRR